MLVNAHHVDVMLPSSEGLLVDKLKAMGVRCGVVPIGMSLPVPANSLMQLCDPSINALIDQLKGKYDLVINNTITTLHGGFIARGIGVPCITYAHEYLQGEPDLVPHGCSADFYIKLVESLSSHILCASEYVLHSFNSRDRCSILYPFTAYENLPESMDASLDAEPISLLVIGTKSRRKNTHFAITVLKALRLRGVSVNLHIIGTDNSGSFQLSQQLQTRAEKNIHIHPHIHDPFSIAGRKINLVCSHSEPFGLTIPEALARGIPVIASASGGPNEILPNELIYGVDDIDACVRTIEKVIKNYESYSNLSKKLYLDIANNNNNFNFRCEVISQAIKQASANFKATHELGLSINLEYFKNVIAPPISADQLIHNISEVSIESPHPLPITNLRELIDEEIASPGSAVLRDIHRFDVVPFGQSENMNGLYKNGLGLAIELLANFNNVGKQAMLAYILLRLQELKIEKSNLKILCLGDGFDLSGFIGPISSRNSGSRY